MWQEGEKRKPNAPGNSTTLAKSLVRRHSKYRRHFVCVCEYAARVSGWRNVKGSESRKRCAAVKVEAVVNVEASFKMKNLLSASAENRREVKQAGGGAVAVAGWLRVMYSTACLRYVCIMIFK